MKKRFILYFLNRRIRQLKKQSDLYGLALSLATLRGDKDNQTYFAYHHARIQRQLNETRRFIDGQV